ncbi:MAG: ribonuclease III [Deltaproteobacteria bacterium]|nr:ribonuclease III [Deltaproteobacteria bacterium]
MTDDELQALEARLGHAFADPSRVRLALTHRSSVAKQSEHNETLEFLGDAVLGLAISELLLRAWPEASEGQLSKRRAALVNEASLAAKAERIDLGPLIQLGRGEEKTGGRRKRSILADAYEALLGAVFLDAGFLAAQAVVARDFAEDVVQPPLDETEAKTRLQELTQRLFRAPPEYTLLRATGPDHAKDFETNVAVAGRVLGQGRGGSKKIAEQAAAREALVALEGFAPGDALPDVGTPAGDDV